MTEKLKNLLRFGRTFQQNLSRNKLYIFFSQNSWFYMKNIREIEGYGQLCPLTVYHFMYRSLKAHNRPPCFHQIF